MFIAIPKGEECSASIGSACIGSASQHLATIAHAGNAGRPYGPATAPPDKVADDAAKPST